MPNFFTWRRRPLSSEVLERAVQVALRPSMLRFQPGPLRADVERAAKALTSAPNQPLAGKVSRRGQRVSIGDVAARAARNLSTTNNVIPADIEAALRAQGMDYVQPFSPGRPLTPYFGYDRRPRSSDFSVARNVTSEIRAGRIPFATIRHTFENYDVANICARYTINSMRSMPLRWRPVDGYLGNVRTAVREANSFWARPDGRRHFNTWLASYMMDKLRYDAGALFRQRNRAGKLMALKVIDGTTLNAHVDEYGDIPAPPAPAFQQFIQGVPWDWLSTEDIIYEPMWPVPESPYGVAPLETVLVNASTDMRLQLFFLQYFSAGAVPEMLLQAQVVRRFLPISLT